MQQEDSPELIDVSTRPLLRRSRALAVLGVALVLRLIVVRIVITHFPPNWLFTRGMEMGLLAQSLLAGEGLSSPFGGHTGPTAFVAPVYPVLVAIIFKCLGNFTLASAVAILLAQIAVNLLTIWLVMWISCQVFNQGAAIVAGLLWACSPPLVWMPTILWETSLSSCLLAGALAYALKLSREQVEPVQWIAVGGFFAAATLTNPALLPALISIALWLMWKGRKNMKYIPLLAVLSFVLVFLPWPVRNARVFHAFVPLRTTVGFELWMGNREGATGFLDESLFPMFNQKELAEYKADGEIAYTRHKSELARRYITDHPLTFISFTAVRTLRFWGGTGTQNGSILFACHAIFTAITGGFGLILLKRRRGPVMLFALPLLLFPIPYLITHAEFRYRIVIDPLLAILAGCAVTQPYRLAVRVTAGLERQPSPPEASPRFGDGTIQGTP